MLHNKLKENFSKGKYELALHCTFFANMYNIVHICLVYNMNHTLQVECKLRISLLKKELKTKNIQSRKKKHIQSRKKWAACSGSS